MALDVFRAHIHGAIHAETRRHRGRSHAVLAGTGFGNHPHFAHALCQQGLADGVVDFVRTAVVEVFALKVNLRPAQMAAQTLGVIYRAGAADIVFQITLKRRPKCRILLGFGIGLFQLGQGGNQRFRHILAAMHAKKTVFIGGMVVLHICFQSQAA